jgi:hypothetical protein
MKCTDIEQQLDDYLYHPAGDHRLTDSEGMDDAVCAAIAMHIQGCRQCEAELERRQTLFEDLRGLPVPEPSAGFFERAVATAVEHNRRRTDPPVRQRYSTALIGLAAGLMAAVLLITMTRQDPMIPGPDAAAPETGLPSINLVTNTVTPVKFAFSSETALADARLSLSLPVGVELVGYDGQSDLSWTTDLEPGTNVLRLPLVGREAGRTAASNLLIARLEHPKGTKTFRLQVTVNPSGATDDE